MKPRRPRPAHRRRPATPVLAVLLAALSLSACASPQAAPGGSSASRSEGARPGGPVDITITIGDDSYPATLADNPAAHDLAAQLPLTLTFRDYNGVEKIAPLPRALTADGVPAGADPEIDDIGYYRPTGDLVLYYGDVGYWNGIVRLGTLTDGMQDIARQPDGFTATVARAG